MATISATFDAWVTAESRRAVSRLLTCLAPVLQAC
jgi:hypothetical protein